MSASSPQGDLQRNVLSRHVLVSDTEACLGRTRRRRGRMRREAVHRWSPVAGAAIFAAALPALVSVPWWASEGQVRNLVEFFCLLALAQMWNLLAGYAGLVSI